MKSLPRRGAVALAAVVVVVADGASLLGRAQSLPTEPLVVGGGRLTVGGDVSVTTSCARANSANAAACTEDTGFFNYTDYDHSVLRMLRVDVTAAFRANGHLSVLGEVRSENASSPRPYALYLRVRPWISRGFDMQIGRIPPTFGAFARRTYASDNILIGYPLAYQYLTSLRPDSLPANADELLRMRGRGWLSNFSIGNTTPHHGMPLISAFRWDTGAQFHVDSGIVDAAVSITMGTLANPLVKDDNNGKQVSGRVAVHPTAGLVAGVSGARGPFVTRQAARLANVENESGSFTQTAWGADAEYSRNYYLVRVETIVSDWKVPIVNTPRIDLPLRATSISIEGRYKIHPRLYAAMRVDHLGFSAVAGTSRTDGWDAPVNRVEIGGGYSLQRNFQIKASFQHNTRPAGRVTAVGLGAAQLVLWF